MAIEEYKDLFPESSNALHAFDAPRAKYPLLGKTEGLEGKPTSLIVDAIGDFFEAGVNFLTLHGYDDFLKELGYDTSEIFTGNAIPIISTENTQLVFKDFRDPRNNDEIGPYQVDGVITYDSNNNITTSIVVPFDFITTAQTNPIEALAQTARGCSYMRDLINGRLTIDPHMSRTRAEASEAHLLKEALVRHPEIDSSLKVVMALTQYPQGIDSIPDHSRYVGAPRVVVNARNN